MKKFMIITVIISLVGIMYGQITNFPHFEGFEDSAGLPVGWSSLGTPSLGGFFGVRTNNPNTGSRHLAMQNGISAVTLMAVTPAIADIETKSVTFWARFEQAWGNVVIRTGTNPGSAASFTEIRSFTTTGIYQEFTVTLENATGPYLAFGTPQMNGNGILIDDILIEAMGPPRPRNLTGEIVNSVAILDWEAPLPYHEQFTHYKAYKNNIEMDMIMSGIQRYEDADILNNIEYTYWVTAVYPSEDSQPSNTVTLTAVEPVLHPPGNLTHRIENGVNVQLEWTFGDYNIHENFEGMELGTNWFTAIQSGYSPGWEITTADAKEGFRSIVSLSSDEDGVPLFPNNWLVSEPFIPVLNSYISYWIGTTDTEMYAESYRLLVSETGSDFADFGGSIWSETLTSPDWQRRSFNLSNNMNRTIRIAFVHDTSTAQSGLKLDGIQVVNPRNMTQPNLQGFVVHRNGSPIHTMTGTNTRSFLDTTAEIGNNNYYITALYADAEESYPGNIVFVTTTDDPGINPPRNLTATATEGVVNLSWLAPVSGVATLYGYRVMRDNASITDILSTSAIQYTDDTVASETTYNYRIQAIYTEATGPTALSDEATVTTPPPTSAVDDALLHKTALIGNYPNPFNPETTISFSIAVSGSTSLKIFDIKGQHVKTIVDENLPSGSHKVVWNGTDVNENHVSSGIYFYRLQTQNSSQTQKMVLMK